MKDTTHPTVAPGIGERWPAIGLGTWRLGESASSRTREVAAVRSALELGYRVFDSAEMYGEGEAERILGEALGDAVRAGDVRRDELFIVSKVYPHHAGTRSAIAACERSLARLGIDALDAYLLHWPGQVPLAETIAAFETLRDRGLIRFWGVSNFDLEAMESLVAAPGGERCAINQVYFSLSQRGPAFDLLPWHQQRGIVTMAYSPIDQGALLRNTGLRRLAAQRSTSPSQLALAWLIDQEGVMAIPKSVYASHLAENLQALSLRLSVDDRVAMAREFPPPQRRTPLAVL